MHGRTTEQSIGTATLTPLETELLQGSLRYFFSLERLVSDRLDRPLRDKDRDLFALLLVGAYQLRHMRIPDHAAINETVGAVGQLKKPWARGLVNAVLRKIASSSDSEPSPDTATSKKSAERSFELPSWWRERLINDLPEHWEAVAQATVERAPMSLRVNTTRVSAPAYLQRLTAAGLAVFQGNFPEHLILAEPMPVRELPGYREGLVSVQDAGAQCAAHLVPEHLPGQASMLDACAAPGGKLFHLAERFPDATLTALELSPDRLAHMAEEAGRLGHDRIRLIPGDATVRDWLTPAGPANLVDPDERFDLILLDAPCSGSGTLRRHPDIKLLREPDDVRAAAELQLAMLKNLWPLVADGGSLIYCTCSLFAEENDQVIEAFLQTIADEPANGAPLSPDALTLPAGTATRYGWQLLPLPAGTSAPDRSVDGFYFARMTRREKAR